MTQASPSAQWWRPSEVIDAWRTFWFRAEPMYTFGLFRIAFGVLAIIWTLWLIPMLSDMLFTSGVTPRQPAVPNTWGVFQIWMSNQAILVGWGVLMAAALALTVGWHSRVAAVIVWILILSFERRDPWAFNSGDVVVRIEALILALSPCGAALSLDQRRMVGSFWSAQTRRIWPVRLIQIQFCVIYVSAVMIKLTGDTWLNGTAVSYALRLVDMQRFSPPTWFSTDALDMNLLTWGTLAIELALGILVWNRRCRPWVLAAGVSLHLGIDVSIMIGIFSWAMFVLYVAWIPPQWVERLPETLKSFRSDPAGAFRRRAGNDGGLTGAAGSDGTDDHVHIYPRQRS